MKKPLLIFLLTYLFHASSFSQVLTISQPTNTGQWYSVNGFVGGQSFTINQAGYLTEIKFNTLGAEGLTLFEVREGQDVNGTLLYSTNINVTAAGWFSVPLPNIPVCEGVYCFTQIYWDYGTLSISDPYPGGSAYYAGAWSGMLDQEFEVWQTINEEPEMVAAIANQTICVGQNLPTINYNITDENTNTVVVSASSSNPSVIPSGNIVLGGAGASRTINLSTAPTVAGTSTISVTLSDGLCSNTYTFNIQVNPLPVVNAGSDIAVCQGSTVTLAGSGTAISYTWDNSVTDGVGFSAVAGNTTYTVTGTGPTGCTSTDQVVVTGHSNPFINVTGQTNPTCNGFFDGTISVSASGGGGGYVYTWIPTGGPGANSTGLAAGTYTINVVDANTCSGTTSVTLTDPAAVSMADPADQIHCAGALSSATTFSGASTYSWVNDQPSIGLAASGSGTSIAPFTVANPGTTNLVANITVTPYVAGCAGPTQTFTITAKPAPTASDPPDQTLCAGSLTSPLNYTGTVAGTTFNWTNSNTTIGLGIGGGGSISSFTAVNGGTTIQTANITVVPNAAGCTGPSQTTVITVNPIPVVTNPGDFTHCANTFTTAIVFAGSVAGTSFNWINSNSTIGLANTGVGNIAAFIATTPGSSPEIATIDVTPEANSCTGTTETFSITINPAPNVTLSAFPDLCDNSSTYTLVEGSPTGGSYSGTGVVGGVFDPTLSGSGTHILTYSYTDGNGCSATASNSIQVFASPAVILSPLPVFCADGTGYSLTEGSPAGGTYSGPGISSTIFDASIAGAGSHTLTYTYTDVNGCSNSDNELVTVNALPALSFPALSPICQSATPITLNMASPAGGTYGGPGVTGGAFDPAAAGAGTHTITYSYVDGVTLCSNSIQQTINVYAQPTILANASDIEICVNETVTLTGSGANVYTWDNGAVDGVALTPVIGTTTFTVVGTDLNGCTGTDQVDVTVYDLPMVDAGVDQTVCEGTAVTLSGSGAVTYLWDNGVTDAIPFTALTSQTYTVTGTDGNGCQNTSTVLVNVDPIPNVIVSSDQTFCKDQTIVLNASGATSYVWDGGASLVDTYTISPTATVAISLIATSGSCSVNKTIVLTYDDPALVSAGDDLTVCAGFIAYLNATGGEDYTWSGPGVTDPANATQGILVDTSAYYYLTAITPSGCSYNDSVFVTSSTDPSCTIDPLTAFSPNGDAINETWRIQGIEAFPENEVTILNRWGDIVFESANYDNETILWTGILANGSDAPPGTYYFIIEITNGPTSTGWVELLK